jgi:hypothetical protein
LREDLTVNSDLVSPKNEVIFILLPKEAIEAVESWRAIESVVNYVNFLRDRCFYIENEIPEAALNIYYVDMWIANVNNGGILQYVNSKSLYNTQGYDLHSMTMRALVAIGAAEFEPIYKEMYDIASQRMQPETGFVRKPWTRSKLVSSFGRLTKEFYNLDNGYSDGAVSESANRLTRLMLKYLFIQPNLKIVPIAEGNELIKVIGYANPHRASRMEEARRRREEFERRDPMIWSARRLCEEAGRTFERFTAGGYYYLDGVEVTGMHLLTAEGLCVLIEFKGEALLFEANRLSPVAEAKRAEGEHAWSAYRSLHPDLYGDLRKYNIDKSLLARVVPPAPIWKKKKR